MVAIITNECSYYHGFYVLELYAQFVHSLHPILITNLYEIYEFDRLKKRNVNYCSVKVLVEIKIVGREKKIAKKVNQNEWKNDTYKIDKSQGKFKRCQIENKIFHVICIAHTILTLVFVLFYSFEWISCSIKSVIFWLSSIGRRYSTIISFKVFVLPFIAEVTWELFFFLCHKLFVWTAFCFKMTLAVNIHYHSLAHCKTSVYKSSIESRFLNEYSRFTAVLLNRWTWHYYASILQFKFTACSEASTVSMLKWAK